MKEVTHVIVELDHPQPRRWMRFGDDGPDEYYGTARELIMCKDCKYWYYDLHNHCPLGNSADDDDYCSRAERKEDESDL